MDYHSSFLRYIGNIFFPFCASYALKDVLVAGLLLARKEIDLLTELVHQKAHLCNGVSVQFSGPLMAGNLLDN